jgi:hypothetical protein
MSDSSFSADELLSSYLDGELTAEDVARLEARLEAETDLRDRLAAMNGAAELASTPVVPLRTGDRDRLIAAALAAGTAAANVTDMGAARERKDRWRTRILTVAAGVAALAIAVPVLRSIDNGDTDSTASIAFDESAGDSSAATDTADDVGTEADLQTPDAEATLESSALTAGADNAAPADATQSAESAQPAIAASLSYLRAFGGPSPDFDPLPDDFGAFADQSTLVTALTDAWTDYADQLELDPTDSPLVPETDEADVEEVTVSDEQDLIGRASRYLDSFGGCGGAIDELVDVIADLPPVLAVDWSIARRDDGAFTVGLFLLPDDEAFAVVIDPSTCTTIDQLFLG